MEAEPFHVVETYATSMDVFVRISASSQTEIEAQAIREYPKEACGFLAGRWEGNLAHVTAILPTANRHFSDPRHHYSIDRATYLHAEAVAQKNGLILLGVYHSHPDSPPVPSATDAKYAFPDWIYWITPVFKGHAERADAWIKRLNPDTWERLNVEIGS